MIDFTVAIRTYNGEHRVPLVLDKLRSQIGTEALAWEIVVVDNNSTDNTAAIIQEYQANWSGVCPLHYYFEPQQGASFARRRAIEAAQGSLIGFLDDDNLPSPNWVATAYAFGQAYPKAGAYGGQIHGEFEVEPPANFKRIAAFLPIVERGEQPLCYNSYKYSYKKVFPPGAGLVIRKQAWLESVPETLLLKGPIGQSLSAKGEDIEALTYIALAGWEAWYNPEMHITHRIPKWRLEREYLIRFFRGIGLSRYQTRRLNYKAWQQPFVMPAYMANDLRKTILHFFKYRRILRTDAIAACEMEFFISSFFSPLYAWKKQLFG